MSSLIQIAEQYCPVKTKDELFKITTNIIEEYLEDKLHLITTIPDVEKTIWKLHDEGKLGYGLKERYRDIPVYASPRINEWIKLHEKIKHEKLNLAVSGYLENKFPSQEIEVKFKRPKSNSKVLTYGTTIFYLFEENLNKFIEERLKFITLKRKYNFTCT